MSKELYVATLKSEFAKRFFNREIIVNYVRDEKGNPFACFVATKKGIGVSVLNPKDKWVKYLGLNAAYKRAQNGFEGVDSILSDAPSERAEQLEDAELRMRARATKYFRGEFFDKTFSH